MEDDDLGKPISSIMADVVLGKEVVVELKNGFIVAGTVVTMDSETGNMKLENLTNTSMNEARLPEPHRGQQPAFVPPHLIALKSLVVRGSSVKFVDIPSSTAPTLMKAVEQERIRVAALQVEEEEA